MAAERRPAWEPRFHLIGRWYRPLEQRRASNGRSLRFQSGHGSIAEAFEYADQVVAAPDHQPAPVRPGPHSRNDLFISGTRNPGCADNFTFVVEKNGGGKAP